LVTPQRDAGATSLKWFDERDAPQRSLKTGHRLEQLLTVREVAEYLRVSPATIYKLCYPGELVHVRISNAIRVAPPDLAHFMAVNRAK
jgi:excisionase family DNA binding protein